MQEQPRSVESVHAARPASDGAGVKLFRNIAPELQQRLDPFLLFDAFGSDDPDSYIAGFPDHPHRGFETVTYMLQGRMRHRDSAGNEGLLEPGGIQWMRAARGVIHSEMPEQTEGVMQGFQLWINLHSSEKLDDPAYEEMGADSIPSVEGEDGRRVKIIAGEVEGVRGPIGERRTEPLYIDVDLPAGTSFAQTIGAERNAFVYVYEGRLEAEGASAIEAHHLGVFDNRGDSVAVRAGDGGSRFLLLAGKPLNEPIAQWGPFVMNSRAEIEQAIAAYRDGSLTS